MAQTAHFTPALFKFLRDLARNNDRDWFKANRARYEQHVQLPLLQFINDFAPHLEKISPHFMADPRKQGGSMFRIYRDTRFSKDKSPYKTHAAAQFRHESGKDVHAPGFYLHLEPGSVFAGVGIWHPDGPSLAKIRQAIVDDPRAWKRASRGKRFSAAFELGGESLKRPPRGFDADHEYVEDLKRKDHVAMTSLTQAAACKPDFLKTFVAICKDSAPYTRFLTEAVGLPY